MTIPADTPIPPALAATPAPPYYAVIFTSRRDERRGDGYAALAQRMADLARRQPGFLGVESVLDGEFGITVSYWASLGAIAAWKAHAEHAEAQRRGRDALYAEFRTRVCRVERETVFPPTDDGDART